MKTDIEIFPYGEVSHTLTKSRWPTIPQHARITDSLKKTPACFHRLVVTFSEDLDTSFARLFRKQAAPDTRLLVLNRGLSVDSVLTRILDLQIRTPQRCYVLDAQCGSGKTRIAGLLIHSLLERWVSAIETNDGEGRILDARIEDGILHVVSPSFDRLDVPIADIAEFKNVNRAKFENFEIEEDGAFIYWPEIDVHFGWPQLQQIVDPEAALKAAQKSEDFNRRYGKAVQKVREAAGLKASDISGISDKQLGRIERGECRLTANAIETLSSAHGIEPNVYMQKLAKALK